ncbi:MAG: hypothetical protein H6662_04995 [Ardenticatenaceae bacterium]|nr:hypothetical protein [Ardenticatenaceae bacterium]MCB9005500.1 hypothetical protein [Ardenticatenaceae bacterium]
MTSRIRAINAYRPKVKLGNMARNDDLVQFIARSTALNESGVAQVLLELRDAVIFFNQRGEAVKLEGLGIYTPAIDLDGNIKVNHRADTALTNALNTRGAFSGNIENSENIGKTGDELVAMWNADHPEDPVS